MKNLKQHIRPLPYYSTTVTNDERWLAGELRREFVPKINKLNLQKTQLRFM
jgi:hypothetical protein